MSSVPSLHYLSDTNLGLSSCSDTPLNSSTEHFADGPQIRTPSPVKGASRVHLVDDDDDGEYAMRLTGDEVITKGDIVADPILYHLADQQSNASSRRQSLDVGPRLSKAAALRMGLEWHDPRDERRAANESAPVCFDNVPGHKRTNLVVNVPSLSEPTVTPRQNRAALLRAGVTESPSAIPVRKDRAAMAAQNKARDAAERAERRKSVQPLASLQAPGMAPRQNRAALLRAGAPLEETRPYSDAAERAAKIKARDTAERAERAERRKTVATPMSLEAPLLTPRANRASMLRTGQGDPKRVSLVGVGPPPPRPPRSRARLSVIEPRSTEAAAPPIAMNAAAIPSTPNPVTAPKATTPERTEIRATPSPASTLKCTSVGRQLVGLNEAAEATQEELITHPIQVGNTIATPAQTASADEPLMPSTAGPSRLSVITNGSTTSTPSSGSPASISNFAWGSMGKSKGARVSVAPGASAHTASTSISTLPAATHTSTSSLSFGNKAEEDERTDRVAELGSLNRESSKLLIDRLAHTARATRNVDANRTASASREAKRVSVISTFDREPPLNLSHSTGHRNIYDLPPRTSSHGVRSSMASDRALLDSVAMAEHAAGVKAAAQQAMAERARERGSVDYRHSMAPPPIRSLGAPHIPPRANRSSLLRENVPAIQLVRTMSRSSVKSGGNHTDRGIKVSSPVRPEHQISLPMPTPTRFLAPRPAPPPPTGRPASMLTFALPEKPTPEKEKKDSLFAKIRKRTSILGPKVGAN